MEHLTCSEVRTIVDKYVQKGYEYTEIEEGCLGYGTISLKHPTKDSGIVIKEYYQNPWSSLHKTVFYSHLPKKYQSK